MVVAGLTFTVIVGAVPLNGMAPGDNVPPIVPEPVTVKVSVALPPVQIDCVPLKAPIGERLIKLQLHFRSFYLQCKLLRHL